MNRFPDRTVAFAQSDAVLGDSILASLDRLGRSIVVGLCGAQGSGKSTTAARLAARIKAVGRNVAVLSIDDFYLTRAQRSALARDLHPLLITRGPPGTHDVALAEATIASLLAARADDVVPAPAFDKSIDDRVAPAQWPRHHGPLDVVLLEGWCVGARPQKFSLLLTPVNALERDEDPDGRWRRYVNEQLGGAYRDLFGRLDLRLFLRAPSFDQVYAWRAEQEAGLRRVPGQALPAMDEPALRRFIAHYERITRWLLADEPADVVIELDADRAPIGWRAGRGTSAAL